MPVMDPLWPLYAGGVRRVPAQLSAVPLEICRKWGEDRAVDRAQGRREFQYGFTDVRPPSLWSRCVVQLKERGTIRRVAVHVAESSAWVSAAQAAVTVD